VGRNASVCVAVHLARTCSCRSSSRQRSSAEWSVLCRRIALATPAALAHLLVQLGVAHVGHVAVAVVDERLTVAPTRVRLPADELDPLRLELGGDPALLSLREVQRVPEPEQAIDRIQRIQEESAAVKNKRAAFTSARQRLERVDHFLCLDTFGSSVKVPFEQSPHLTVIFGFQGGHRFPALLIRSTQRPGPETAPHPNHAAKLTRRRIGVSRSVRLERRVVELLPAA
jgi:hypothetical protein